MELWWSSLEEGWSSVEVWSCDGQVCHGLERWSILEHNGDKLNFYFINNSALSRKHNFMNIFILTEQ